jgi:hypothetical protein
MADWQAKMKNIKYLYMEDCFGFRLMFFVYLFCVCVILGELQGQPKIILSPMSDEILKFV